MLDIVAVVVLSVSLILHIVGIAIPYWEYESNFDNGSSSFYRGLWKSCSKSPYFAEVCVAFDLDRHYDEPSLLARRAMEILGTLSLAASWFISVVKVLITYGVLKINLDGSVKPVLELFISLGVVSGALIIIGVIVYATRLRSSEIEFHASFCLCIVAAVGAIAGGVLGVIDKKPINPM